MTDTPIDGICKHCGLRYDECRCPLCEFCCDHVSDCQCWEGQ